MMSQRKTLLGTAAALLLGTVVSTLTPDHAQADDAGAFIGGMMASRVMSNIRASSQAQQEQAYYAQQQYQQQQRMQQAAPAPQTPTQRLDELDKLAAGGYITPEEYKKRRQAILDSM